MREAAGPSLKDQVIQGVIGRDQEVLFARQHKNGVVSAVVKTDHCVDGRVFKVGGAPSTKGLEGIHGWTVGLGAKVAPGVTEYIGPCDGTADVKNPDVEAYKIMMADNSQFIVRLQRRSRNARMPLLNLK